MTKIFSNRKARRIMGIACAALMSVVFITGCSASGKSDVAANTAAQYSKSEAMDMSYEGDFGYAAYDDYFAPAATEVYKNGVNTSKATSAGPVTQSSADVQFDAAGRKLIKRVNLSMQTLAFDNAVEQLEKQAAALGGYIQSSSISNGGGYYIADIRDGYLRSLRNAYYTVRIPSQWLNAFTDAMGAVGTVTDKSLETEDVTLEYVDNEARAESLKIQQERLLALLEKADNITDIIELEARLSDVIYQLERKESVLRNYDNLVEFSTIYVSIAEVERITYEEPARQTIGQRISSGLSNTWYDIAQGFENFVVWFTVNIPYIIFWAAVIAAVAVIVVRKVKKHMASSKAMRVAKKAAEEQKSDN